MNSELTSALASHFADIEFIGEGMTSKVYKALDKKTSTTVAIKVLNPHLKTDKISLERFKREIQIARAIQHPNVIAIYDLEVRGDLNYLVMEFIDGISLKDYIKLNSPLTIQTVVSIITQLLEALSLCHSKSVIHRDLKPQNIMITADGNIKVLDFGIARMTALSDLTQVGTSLGSPEYMAPELFAASVYEPRSDLYAVGVITYELLSGEIPFQGDTLAVIFNKHLNDPLPPLSKYRKDIPQWLEQITMKLLAKKTYQRYQSADDVSIDLNTKRVMSNGIPVHKTKPCFNCGEQTPADAFVCFACGDDGSERYRKGNYYIICDSPQDPEKLRDFFRDYIGKDIVCRGKRGTVLASKVDEVFVNSFKKAAQRYGIHVVSKGWFARNLGRAFSLLLRLPIGVIVIILAFSLFGNRNSFVFLLKAFVLLGGWLLVKSLYVVFFPKPDHSSKVDEGFVNTLKATQRNGTHIVSKNRFTQNLGRAVLTVLIVLIIFLTFSLLNGEGESIIFLLLTVYFLLVGWWVKNVYITFFSKPVLNSKDFESGKLSELRWFGSISPLLKLKRNEDMQKLISQTLERLLIFEKHARSTSNGVRVQMWELVVTMLPVANHISLVESAQQNATLAKLMREHSLKMRNNQDTGDLENTMQSLFNEEENYAALVNRFSMAMALFNRLMGMALVFDKQIEDAELEVIRDGISELRQEVDIWQQVKGDLAPLPGRAL